MNMSTTSKGDHSHFWHARTAFFSRFFPNRVLMASHASPNFYECREEQQKETYVQ